MKVFTVVVDEDNIKLTITKSFYTHTKKHFFLFPFFEEKKVFHINSLT